jgi:hypothetical protein
MAPVVEGTLGHPGEKQIALGIRHGDTGVAELPQN